MITPVTPLISPAALAKASGVSIEKIEATAKRLGIGYQTNAARRRLLTFSDSLNIDRNLAR
jgi:hypothetical protein